AACGLDAVEDGHLDVDERDVGEVLAGQREGLPSVGGLGHDLDVVLQFDERPESAADERLVVDQQDPDHDVPPTGSSAWTEKPPSGRGSALSRPPRAATRSRMPCSPTPGSTAVPGAALPLSSMRTTRDLGRRSIRMAAVAAPECRRVLVGGSCTMRWVVGSTAAGSSCRCP